MSAPPLGLRKGHRACQMCSVISYKAPKISSLGRVIHPRCAGSLSQMTQPLVPDLFGLKGELWVAAFYLSCN